MLYGHMLDRITYPQQALPELASEGVPFLAATDPSGQELLGIVRCGRCAAHVTDDYPDRSVHASWHFAVEDGRKP